MDLSRMEKEIIEIVKEAKNSGKSETKVREEIELLIRKKVEEGE